MNQEIIQRLSQLAQGEVPTGYQKTKVGIVPKEWEIKTLGEVSTKKGEYGINAAAVPYDSKLPTYIRITDITDDLTYDSSKKVSVDDEESGKYYLYERDIVLARTGATVGKSYLYNPKDGMLVFAGFLIKFSISEEYDHHYIFSNLNTSFFRNWVQITSQRSGQPGINAEEYALYPIPLPPLPEQQKIAQILSTQDKVIQLKEKLIEQKKAQKKYLMLQLLTGKQRLEGFSGEWEQKIIGNFTNVFSGGTPKTNVKDYYNGNIPFIRSGEIGNSITELFISQEGFDSSSAKMVNEGDLLLALYGANSGECSISKQSGAINQAILCIRTEENIIFLFHYFSESKEKIVKEYLQGGQGNLSAQIIKSIKILLPPLPEQEAIANILTTADKEIDLLQKDLDQEKLKKKSLMQLLLTGIVRVNP